MKQATFNQWIAGILTLGCLGGIIAVFFFPSTVDAETKQTALKALTGTLGMGVILFLKVSSDVKNAAQISQMTDVIGNSVPNDVHNSAIAALKDSAPKN